MDSKFDCNHPDLSLITSSAGSYCRGQRKAFIPSSGSKLSPFQLTERVRIKPSCQTCVFLQSTCMINLGHMCTGVIIALKMKRHSVWRLGIVHALSCKRREEEDILHYFEWIGGVDSLGIPLCFRFQYWHEMKGSFQKKVVKCSDVDELHMLNQVSGIRPLGLEIQADVRNLVDGGIQSSKCGPDKLTIEPFHYERDLSSDPAKQTVTEKDTEHTDVLHRTNRRSRSRKKKLELDDVSITQHCGSKCQINANAECLIIVSTSKANKSLQNKYSAAVPKRLNKTINFGSIGSCYDTHSMHQLFFCLKKESFNSLSKQYPEGLPLSDEITEGEQIDSLLREMSCSDFSLVSVEKLLEHTSKKQNGFVRIFAGGGSPPIDETFCHVDCADQDIRVHYKLGKGGEYNEYVPLSVSLFESTLHSMKVSWDTATRLLRCFGKHGLYGSRTSMLTIGSQSYVGERKTDKMSTPTVSEGPSERKLEMDKPKFVYYRRSINALRWPYALSVINNLVNQISIAPYYLYNHLREYYPHNNDRRALIRFCTLAILTINFCCSCHVDSNDRKPALQNDMMEELYNNTSQWAKLSAAHLLWWGLSIPTSCCYQYIKRKNDIKVYQWFMCPGLGTTYRIKNYWVHIMLAGLFSHCTSCAIYIVEGKVYFGSCPDAIMFAWGGT